MWVGVGEGRRRPRSARACGHATGCAPKAERHLQDRAAANSRHRRSIGERQRDEGAPAIVPRRVATERGRFRRTGWQL